MFFLSMLCAAISGFCWGFHESLTHRYPSFKEKWEIPNRCDAFLDPRISWLNKYKNRDPKQGRTKWPVWFTDAKHALGSITFITIFYAGVFLAQSFGNILFEVLAVYAVYSLANSFAWNLFTK